MDVRAWIDQNGAILGIFATVAVAVVPSVWALLRYLNVRTKELQQQRFRIYHDLIRDLVEEVAPGRGMKLDRQVAIVFELRHFPEYFELTIRMLEGLRETWTSPRTSRLIDEIDHTIAYIAAHSRLTPSRRTIGADTP